MDIDHFVAGIHVIDGDDFLTPELFEKRFGKREVLNPILGKLTPTSLINYQENTFIFDDKVIRFTSRNKVYESLMASPKPNLETIKSVDRYNFEHAITGKSSKYVVVSDKYTDFSENDFDIMDDERKDKFKNDICNAIVDLKEVSNLYHSDISFDNIVYDESTDNYILIDYGMMNEDNMQIAANRAEFESIGLVECVKQKILEKLEKESKKYLKYKNKYLLLKKKLGII